MLGAATLALAFRRGVLTPQLHAEEGSLLIEVMIGAVVVAIATVAVLNGLDGAQATGARNKARSVASTLAQQDQERMRSLKIQDLSGYSETRTVAVRGVSYTVESAATWVSDSSGVLSCTNNSATAQYLRITSAVTAPASRGAVEEASLVTPPPGSFGPNQGTVAVQVVDRMDSPIQGVSVGLTGPGSLSDVTNSEGCAIFALIQEGLWNIELASLGLVGWDGVSPAQSNVGVTGGTTTLKKLELDRSAEIITRFQTKVGAALATPAKSRWATVAHPKLASPGTKTFSAAAPADFVRATTLFPFADGYGVFAGPCDENNPTRAPTNDPNYFTSFPLDLDGSLADPAPGGSMTVFVRVPAINVSVLNNVGLVTANARVVVSLNLCTSAGAPVSPTPTFPDQFTNLIGALPEPGHPFGEYRVCAQTTTGTLRHGHADLSPFASSGHVNELVRNIDPAGVPVAGTLQIRMNQSGSCH